VNRNAIRTTLALMAAIAPTSVAAAIHYVDVNSANPVAPYTNWATAATVIQDAIDIALPGAEVVVTNGVYEVGGHAVYPGATNRVALTKPLTLRSINGPKATIIRGYQTPGITNGPSAIRCAYLTNGATMVGFTLKDGATREYYNIVPVPELMRGAGAWCESASAVLSNCVLRGNSAAFAGLLRYCHEGSGSESISPEMFPDCPGYIGGGGVFRGTLYNCELWNNSAHFGGGAYFSTLNSCLLVGNVAQYGGGACGGTLNNCLVIQNYSPSGAGVGGGILNNCTVVSNAAWNDASGVGGGAGVSASKAKNCIVYYNRAGAFEDNHAYSTLQYSCTTPWPTDGVGNLTNAPGVIVRLASTGTNDVWLDAFQLEPTSPCINAGRNAYAPAIPDFSNDVRVVGGTVDIGAIEFQSPQSTLSYAWLQQHTLPLDGSIDSVDLDGDGYTTLQEWQGQTEPADRLSFPFRIRPSLLNIERGLALKWDSVLGRRYILERSTNTVGAPVFTSASPDVTGESGTTTYTEMNSNTLSKRVIYRVRLID
jgi:hypothetical protein